jgi:carbonic anhydrase
MRRLVLLAALASVLLAPVGLTSAAEETTKVTAEEAVERLTEGNARFAEGKSVHPRADPARRTDTGTRGQQPFVTVLGCSDSRAPLETVFDQGIGDIFTVRVAGNVCADDEMASLEYGAGHLGTHLVVVLGHSDCGAVTAAVTGAEVHGHMRQLVDKISPAVAEAQAAHRDLHGKDLVPAAIEANVWYSIEQLLLNSPMTRRLVETGKLQVIGAIYDVKTGKVEWLGQHPKQKKLLQQSR